MKNGLKNGLFAGTALIILFLIVHFINPKLNFGLIFALVSSAIVQLFFMMRAGREERKNYGGDLSLGEAFIPTFITFAISSLINNLFILIMLKYNAELMQIAVESSKEMIEGMMSMTGMSEDQIALGLEEQEENMAASQPFSIKSVVTNWFVSLLIPGMIYTLIASFIVKKKRTATA